MGVGFVALHGIMGSCSFALLTSLALSLSLSLCFFLCVLLSGEGDGQEGPMIGLLGSKPQSVWRF